MSKSTTFRNDLLQLIYNNVIPAGTVLANLGSGVQAATTAGSLYVALHTDDPGVSGSQTTNEMTIQNYARIAVVRSSAGWTVSGNNASNAAQIRFPSSGSFGATNSPEDAKFFSVGTASSGAGNIIHSGHLGESLLSFTAESSTDILTVKNHNYVAGDEIFIDDSGDSSTLPTGLTRGVYFVLTPTGDDFQISATSGGAAVNFTTDGEGFVGKIIKKTLSNGDALTFEIGDLDIFES